MTRNTSTRGMARIGSSGRKGERIRRFVGGRVCAEDGCSTLLSTYNGSVLCGVHEVPRTFRPRPSLR